MDEILAAARVAGVSLRVVGGDLAARPAEAVTPELVALLRENKPRIIAALRREPAGALDVGGLLRLIESNPRLAQVARTCAKGVFNGEHRLGASAYREGSVGVLAGALSSYYGQYEPDSWRAWLPAAWAVLESDSYREEKVGKVVHVKRDPYDVYIGRAMAGYKKSIWRNDFEIGKDGTREEVIEKYERYLLEERPDLVARLPELLGKVLGCWCAPKACHGDVLIRLASAREEDNANAL